MPDDPKADRHTWLPVRLPRSLEIQLRAEAERRGCTLNELCLEALRVPLAQRLNQLLELDKEYRRG